MRGELRFWPKNPDCEMVRVGRDIELGTHSNKTRTHRIASARHDAKGPIVRLFNVDDRTTAEAFVGATWFERRDAFPEPESDEVYLLDLLGLPVRTEEGTSIGKLVDVWQVGSADVLVIQDAVTKSQHLVPNIDQFVLSADPAKGEIVIRPIEGLLSDPAGV